MAKFLIVWDQLGLESVIDATEWEHEENENLLEMIKTGKSVYSKSAGVLSSLILRARFNSHRFYEIYAVEATDGITKENITDMFEQNPQGGADLIRERGVKVYSDRVQPGTIKIK